MKTPQIVKVQVPQIATPAGGQIAGYVVYARGRRHMVEQTITRATSEALGRDPKGYFEGHFTGYHWQLGRRVADQDW